MADLCTRSDDGNPRSALLGCGPDEGEAAVLAQLVGHLVTHLLEVVEALLVWADKDDGNLVLGVVPRALLSWLCRGAVGIAVEEADVHVQVAAVVEGGQAEGNPVL